MASPFPRSKGKPAPSRSADFSSVLGARTNKAVTIGPPKHDQPSSRVHRGVPLRVLVAFARNGANDENTPYRRASRSLNSRLEIDRRRTAQLNFCGGGIVVEVARQLLEFG
jgi:hypothetical protein